MRDDGNMHIRFEDDPKRRYGYAAKVEEWRAAAMEAARPRE